MANISVSELLFDRDFVDTITVLRQVEWVGDDGNAIRQVMPISTIASMQAATGDDFTVLPDASRVSSTYECITDFPLLSASDATTADIVLWRGMQWTVTSVANFSNFAGGAGHYEAMVELKPVRVAMTQSAGGILWDDAQMTWDCLWDVAPGGPVGTTTWNGQDPTTWDGDSGAVWDVEGT